MNNWNQDIFWLSSASLRMKKGFLSNVGRKAGHFKKGRIRLVSELHTTGFNGCKVSREIKWAQEYYIWSSCHLDKQAKGRHSQATKNLGNEEHMTLSWKTKAKNSRWNQTKHKMNSNAGVEENSSEQCSNDLKVPKGKKMQPMNSILFLSQLFFKYNSKSHIVIDISKGFYKRRCINMYPINSIWEYLFPHSIINCTKDSQFFFFFFILTWGHAYWF